MTTAHRPTFEPARGGTGKNEGDLSKLSQQYSSKDMPSETRLKYRQKGQATAEEVRSKDLRRELEEKERNAARERRSRDAPVLPSPSSSKRPRIDQAPSGNLDADDPLDDDEDNEDSDDDEDDTAELMAELSRIKKERAVEKAQKDAEEAEEQERIRTENILHGNPLLAEQKTSTGSDFKVKRRWDDDVVFKNCAKGIDERKKDQTFINDAIRSEFHKKFMEKYIK
uniref:Spliceosome-associated protein CWC15 homolog n=1 Tax=Plectus sambesii TaxID=2011161 RepID=A0A914VX39_9BILA